ncbi:MAG TPA: G1 family glutamic endopeptidase [Thermoplasmata archaeon]|nr:G1 family glutamic endopeptidase [Thermoplasmata archaeon]
MSVRSVTVGCLAVLVLAYAAPGLALATGSVHRGLIMHGTTTSSSTNWAGYAVTSGRHTVTDVKGSWIVPSIHGSCPSSNQYSSFWVGIDGFSSSTVEQTGTDSDCQSGSAVYYAWYEFFPKPSHLITTLTVSAGDTISAEVSFAGTSFKATIKDVTTGKSFSTSANVKAQRNSAEWIAEAPSGSGGILPLADFGNVSFGTDYTSVASTNDATISGSTHVIGGFTNIQLIDMINNAGTAAKATPSALSTDGSSFTVAWNSAGP